MRSQFDAQKFSLTCKIWRNMHNLTVRDMVELCGMATSTYGFVESGDRAPTMAEFSHLCELMSFDAAFFFKTPEKGKNG